MAAKNRLSIKTSIINARFDSGQGGDVLDWITAAEQWLWGQASWRMKRVDAENLAVTAGDDTPTPPAALRDVRSILNENGEELRQMEPLEFERTYRGGKLDAVTAEPEAFKVVDGIITLGPTPAASRAYTCSHTRKLFHFDNTGTTVVAGEMGADTDFPFLPSGYHMLYVHQASILGLGLENDPTAVGVVTDRDELLEAAIEELAEEDPRPIVFTRRRR